MSADQQYLILFTALSRLYSAFSQMRLRGRQSLSEIECRVNGVFFLMPWGCIDGTPHEIYRPQVEPQAQFYSGHRHYHVMNTQLIVDNQGNIVFLQAGFLGSMNDAGNFILMDRIGPGTACDMPRRTVLLADKGYGDFVPLLTPFRAAQIRRMQMHQQRRARKFNRKLSQCRVIVEHTKKVCENVSSRWKFVAPPKVVPACDC